MRLLLSLWVTGIAILAISAPGAEADRPEAAPAKLPTFRTAVVTRADLSVIINVTGTVEPQEIRDVCAQVGGTIESLGKDASGKTIDYGSLVEQGAVLAKIADASYKLDAEQAQATLQRAQAELSLAIAKLKLAESQYRRMEEQAKNKTITATELDAAAAELGVAKANVAASEAGLANARVALERAEANLHNTLIKSPIKGVVIDRRVTVGQPVAPGVNAAGLFLVADLSKMVVRAAVDEKDIGQIHEQAPVRFTCSAFPEMRFEGTVRQIRLNATMMQNVVTYTMLVGISDSDRLLPYLTANVWIEAANLKNVLVVPSAALRWQPRPEWEARGVEEPASRPRSPQVWVQDGQSVKRIAVQVGASDRRNTQITGGDLKEGTAVIIGTAPAD